MKTFKCQYDCGREKRCEILCEDDVLVDDLCLESSQPIEWGETCLEE